MTSAELAVIIALVEEAESDPGLLVPLDVVREIMRIRRERLTGTLELDCKDGKIRSKRLVPARERVSDAFRLE